MITIHWDFTTGKELSYAECVDSQDDFCTNCLDFFTIDYDAVVVKRNGEYISSKELLANNGEYTSKEIRNSHNILKMLKSGALKWRSPSMDKWKENSICLRHALLALLADGAVDETRITQVTYALEQDEIIQSMDYMKGGGK